MADLSDCVWKAPVPMTTKHALAALYADHFENLDQDGSNLARFFSKTLELRNCGWDDIINEIKDFQKSKSADFDRIHKLYKCLADMDFTGTSAEKLK